MLAKTEDFNKTANEREDVQLFQEKMSVIEQAHDSIEALVKVGQLKDQTIDKL